MLAAAPCPSPALKKARARVEIITAPDLRATQENLAVSLGSDRTTRMPRVQAPEAPLAGPQLELGTLVPMSPMGSPRFAYALLDNRLGIAAASVAAHLRALADASAKESRTWSSLIDSFGMPWLRSR
jgi:hypothetical protein